MAKIFKTSDDVLELALSKFHETGLPQVGVDLKVMSLTKANTIVKVSKASATTDFLTDGGGYSIHMFIYEEAFDRLDDAGKIKLIEGALSNVSYDSEKDKLILDNSQYGEMIRMRKKYQDYVDLLELSSIIIATIDEEEKAKKEAEKEMKKANKSK